MKAQPVAHCAGYMNMRKISSSHLDWLLFIALSFMWGSSYLFIKIGVNAGLEPLTLIMVRLFFGVMLIGTVVLATRERLPRDVGAYAKLTILAFFGIALPFSLITWAEDLPEIDSALASVLTAPTPLFVVPFAALLLADERISINKLLGIVIGLAGVAVLVGFDPAQIRRGELAGVLALIGACVSYAFAGVFARKYLTGYRPMIPAFFEVGLALVMVSVGAFILENPLARVTSMPLEAWFAVIWLGIMGSGLAFLVFFRLTKNWGATRTALVAYVMPIWGIVLGALVLGEVVGLDRLSGTALVIAGIALVNFRRDAITGAIASLRGRRNATAETAAEAVAEQR
jgi:drug/metabolite transporter (DMT)-like permease